MPKVSLNLQDAKAKDAEILAKLSKVQQAAQGSKQQTKLNQQKSEFAQQARKFASETRKLEADLEDVVRQLGLAGEQVEERTRAEESIADVWFQVAGVRTLLSQVKRRDAERLRKAPDQAIQLEGVFSSVSVALSSVGNQLAVESSELDQECSSTRQALRKDMTAEGGWSSVAERRADGSAAAPPDLSDDEDAMLERIADGPETYSEDLAQLNDQVTAELAELDKELAELRKKRTGWDDEAHFRFNCIKKQFQGKARELLMDRLSLEFPHLSRDQLQAHEAHCDALKYAAQRQAAAFRQWRRSRAALLRQAESRFEDRRRAEELMAVRRQDVLDHKAKQKRLQADLQVERVRASSKQREQRRLGEEESRRQKAFEAKKDDAHRRHIEAVKGASREYDERKKDMRRQEEVTAFERERLDNEERERRMQRNAERIELRRQRDELKHREVAQQRRAAEQEARERQERLERAMEALRVEAPRDPERLFKEPERGAAYQIPLVCVTRGPHAGFDEQRLMGDARYKISAALQAAGLYGSKAGHQALAQVQAPRQNNPTYASSVFAAPPGGGGYPS